MEKAVIYTHEALTRSGREEENHSQNAEQMAEESESLPIAIEIVLELAESENNGAYIQGGVIFNSAGCVLYDPQYQEASEKKLWDFAYGE